MSDKNLSSSPGRNKGSGDSLHEARVEAAAEGMWNLYGDRGMFTHAPEHLRNGFMKDARAALAAADALLPSVGQIAEVLENHTKRLDTLTCCGLNLERPDQQYRHWAEAVLVLLRGEVTGDE